MIHLGFSLLHLYKLDIFLAHQILTINTTKMDCAVQGVNSHFPNMSPFDYIFLKPNQIRFLFCRFMKVIVKNGRK